ncbi:MAG: dihydrofolate reductase family protein [Pseudomonadota bacterium]
MRKIAALTFASLDGVVQGPMSPEEDTRGGFTRGGWAAPYFDAVMPHVMKASMLDPYDILFGRRTYDDFARVWPNDGFSPVGRILNSARKFVVTSSTDNLSWNKSIPVSGNMVQAITNIKNQSGPLLQIHGSIYLLKSLLEENLLDEIRLWTFPVIVGAGQRLFDDTLEVKHLKLKKAEVNDNGVAMSIYSMKKG